MVKILIVGEGGQGIQFIGQLLAKTAFDNNLSSTLIPNFGVEQRGGISIAFVQIDNKDIPYPKFDKADYFILMSARDRQRSEKYLSPETKLINMTEYSGDLPNKVHNVFALAKLLKISNILTLESVKKTLEDQLSQKFIQNPALKEDNFKALESGYGQD